MASRILSRTFQKFQRQNVRNFGSPSFGTMEEMEAAANWYRKTLWFIALPSLVLSGLFSLRVESVNHHKPRAEFVAYEHLRIRSKAFPWGDGNHSLFHNPHSNALPEGYETEDEHH